MNPEELLAEVQPPEEAGPIEPPELDQSGILPEDDLQEIGTAPHMASVPEVVGKNPDGSYKFSDGSTFIPSTGLFYQGTKGPNGETFVVKPDGKLYASKPNPAGEITEDPNPDAVGEKALEGLSPGQATLVRNLTQYKAAPPSGTAQRSPYWQRVMQKAYQFDPTYDASMYNTRSATRRDYYAGQTSRAIKSLNTVTQHLGSLSDVAGKLGNTDFTPYNGLKNYISKSMGKPEIQEFETVANAAAGELAYAVKGAAPTLEEIKHWRSVIDSSSSPAQLNGVIQEAIGLMAGRINALHDRYQTNMGKPMDFKILDDKSRQILNKLGGAHAIEADDMDSPNTQTAPQEQPPLDDKVVGKVYRDASGHHAKYLGEGKWEEIP